MREELERDLLVEDARFVAQRLVLARAGRWGQPEVVRLLFVERTTLVATARSQYLTLARCQCGIAKRPDRLVAL